MLNSSLIPQSIAPPHRRLIRKLRPKHLAGASNLLAIRSKELLSFLFILGMVGGFIVIEPVVALTDLYVGS